MSVISPCNLRDEVLRLSYVVYSRQASSGLDVNEICTNGNSDYVIRSGYVMGGPSVIDVLPSDVAVWVLNARLMPVS
jgi:hypothetical protein